MNRIDLWRLQTVLHAGRGMAVVASIYGGWFVHRGKK